jgi:DNA-binding winged helix-turn-helix (wHTH) protein
MVVTTCGRSVHGSETTAKLGLSTFAAMDVVLVRWPGESDRLAQLRQEGRPRLLLVDSYTPPPLTGDALEDWIRVPAREADVRARIAVLSLRAGMNGTAAEPVLDEDGVLRFRGQWVSLPPVEARLTRALLERYGSVVSRETLTSAGWPGGAPGRNALDVHVLRLRRRLDPIGLAIRTVRSRGYLLEDATQPAWRLTASAAARMASGSPR